MPTITGILATAFLAGLLGGVHWVGMCGGIVATLTAGLPREQRTRPGALLPYLLADFPGRIGGYSVTDRR